MAVDDGCPGLWFFGMDRSVYGTTHVHRRQARRLAQLIARLDVRRI